MTRGSKIRIPFLDMTELDVPIIEFHIMDKTYCAIVDTGAESTLFDPALKTHLSIDKISDISIVGVSGESETQSIQFASAIVWMRNKSGHIFITTVKGYVNQISHLSSHFLGNNDRTISAIFGSDMLNELNANVDFVKKEVQFNL